MKSTILLLIAMLPVILLAQSSGQENYIRQREQDFERFRREREQDFQNFVEARERELRAMEQAYQDYYNELHGLRNHYLERNDTERATIVEEIIEFEDQIAEVTGKRVEVTEAVVVEEVPDQQPDAPDPADPYRQEPPEELQDKEPPVTPEPDKAREPVQTTFFPLPEEGRMVPVLLPLPESKARITSAFGPRNHPVLNRQRMHNGIDFGSGMNAEVYSAADGRVKLAQYSNSFGNWIIIEHSNGYTSVYAHLNSFNVKKGDMVSKGDLIGLTGSTGRSTGPHLHYEVRLNGTPVNPEGYLTEIPD